MKKSSKAKHEPERCIAAEMVDNEGPCCCPQVFAHYEEVGGGGAQGSEEVAGEQPGGHGHRGDEGRGACPAGRGHDLHVRAHLQPDPQVAPHHRRRHAAFPAAIRYQRCEYIYIPIRLPFVSSSPAANYPNFIRKLARSAAWKLSQRVICIP